jgi:uncharacterized protein (DUF169 family)
MLGLNQLYDKFISSFGVEGLEIPFTAVKFFHIKDIVPKEVQEYKLEAMSFTSCQATRAAALGESVFITRDNIGCIAAGISLGLVDAGEGKPLRGNRVYTDIMRKQSGTKDSFIPPSPKEFTDGLVYACKDAGKLEFCLFGKNDSGRFKDIATAKRAVSEMIAIQPATTQGIFFYSHMFSNTEFWPDVILLSVRPIELSRIIQAYQFHTGKRVKASMGAVRVLDSDLIVRPFLTNEINISTYCIGARLIARYDADRMGVGMPFQMFKNIVNWMEMSKTGYPFHLYPGAKD